MKPENKSCIVLLLSLVQILLEFCVVLTKTEKLELWSQCRVHSECLSNECCTTTDFEHEQQSKTCGLNCTGTVTDMSIMQRAAVSKTKSGSGSKPKTRSNKKPKQNPMDINNYDSPVHKSEVLNGRMIRYYKKPYLTWFQASNYCVYGKGTLADYRDRADHDAINSFVDRSQYPGHNRQHGGWLGGYNFFKNASAAWISTYTSSNPDDFNYYAADDSSGDMQGGRCTVACVRKDANGIHIPIRGLRLCYDNCHIRKSFVCLYAKAWPPNIIVIPRLPPQTAVP